MKGLQTSIIFYIGFTLLLTGLFNKAFGQPQTNFLANSQTETEEHTVEWDFYFSNVDNKLSLLFVDLGLYKIAPLADKSVFVWVSIKMNHSLSNGLSSNGEDGLLEKIEDKVVSKLSSKIFSTYIGRLTSNGFRDLYFYMEDTASYSKAITEVMTSYPEYQYEFGSKTDETWSAYFDFLYPSPQQFQSIQNRQIIDQLEKNGDKLTKMRDVDHWIYFKTKKDQDAFLNKIQFDGFTIVTQTHDKKSGGLPYKLHIKRIDKVDWNSVDAYVIYLWKLANDYQGVYDCWETSVEVD